MDTAHDTTPATAMTTTEEDRLLHLAKQEVRGESRGPILPQIKMVNDKSEVEGMAKGEFYISRSVKNEAGEYSNEIKSIGMNPVVNIITRRYSYSLYSKSQERLIAWTNEFEGFSDEHPVVLMNNSGESPVMETCLPYPKFKEYARSKYWNTVEDKSLLKFRNVFYVWFEGQVYRMFVSNASVVGVQPGGESGSYKNPEPLSFAALAYRMKVNDEAFWERDVRIGSREIKGKGYYIMTFADVGEAKDKRHLLGVWNQIRTELAQRFVEEYGKYMPARTGDGGATIQQVPQSQYGTDTVPALVDEEIPDSYYS